MRLGRKLLYQKKHFVYNNLFSNHWAVTKNKLYCIYTVKLVLPLAGSGLSSNVVYCASLTVFVHVIINYTSVT